MSQAQSVDPSGGKKPMTARARRGILAGSILLLVGAAVATYLVLTAGPAQSRQFATFHLQEGTVEIQRAGQGPFAEAAEGQTLREGDVIRTGPDGRAEIEYFDGSIIEADQASGGTFSRVVELSGSDSRFETSTPTAVASVRGTDYFVLFNPAQTQIIGVIEGVVQVGGSVGDDVDLTALRGVDVSTSGELSEPYDLPPELLNSDFLRWNLCERDFLESLCAEVEPKVQKKKEKKEEGPPPPPPQAPESVPVTSPPPEGPRTVIQAGRPGEAAAAGAAPLAFTGLRLTVWVAIAVALALSGLGLYVVGRRRGSAASDGS